MVQLILCLNIKLSKTTIISRGDPQTMRRGGKSLTLSEVVVYKFVNRGHDLGGVRGVHCNNPQFR